MKKIFFLFLLCMGTSDFGMQQQDNGVNYYYKLYLGLQKANSGDLEDKFRKKIEEAICKERAELEAKKNYKEQAKDYACFVTYKLVETVSPIIEKKRRPLDVIATIDSQDIQQRLNALSLVIDQFYDYSKDQKRPQMVHNYDIWIAMAEQGGLWPHMVCVPLLKNIVEQSKELAPCYMRKSYLLADEIKKIIEEDSLYVLNNFGSKSTEATIIHQRGLLATEWQCIKLMGFLAKLENNKKLLADYVTKLQRHGCALKQLLDNVNNKRLQGLSVQDYYIRSILQERSCAYYELGLLNFMQNKKRQALESFQLSQHIYSRLYSHLCMPLCPESLGHLGAFFQEDHSDSISSWEICEKDFAVHMIILLKNLPEGQRIPDYNRVLTEWTSKISDKEFKRCVEEPAIKEWECKVKEWVTAQRKTVSGKVHNQKKNNEQKARTGKRKKKKGHKKIVQSNRNIIESPQNNAECNQQSHGLCEQSPVQTPPLSKSRANEEIAFAKDFEKPLFDAGITCLPVGGKNPLDKAIQIGSYSSARLMSAQEDISRECAESVCDIINEEHIPGMLLIDDACSYIATDLGKAIELYKQIIEKHSLRNWQEIAMAHLVQLQHNNPNLCILTPAQITEYIDVLLKSDYDYSRCEGLRIQMAKCPALNSEALKFLLSQTVHPQAQMEACLFVAEKKLVSENFLDKNLLENVTAIALEAEQDERFILKEHAAKILAGYYKQQLEEDPQNENLAIESARWARFSQRLMSKP